MSKTNTSKRPATPEQLMRLMSLMNTALGKAAGSEEWLTFEDAQFLIERGALLTAAISETLWCQTCPRPRSIPVVFTPDSASPLDDLVKEFSFGRSGPRYSDQWTKEEFLTQVPDPVEPYVLEYSEYLAVYFELGGSISSTLATLKRLRCEPVTFRETILAIRANPQLLSFFPRGVFALASYWADPQHCVHYPCVLLDDSKGEAASVRRICTFDGQFNLGFDGKAAILCRKRSKTRKKTEVILADAT